jgi:phosphoglycerate dehydrogenase-like enzyme
LLERCEPLRRASDPNGPQNPSDEVRAILTRGRGRITDSMMELFPQLRAIARAGAGIDNLDVAAAARRNIPVIFSPGMNGRTVAEHTFALMLNLVRRITPWAVASASGRWEERKNYQGGELGGMTLGIVGFGNIGRRVARLARAFEMNVLIAKHRGVAADSDFAEMPLDDLMATADIVTLHLPFSRETVGVIGARQISRMKSTSCIINTARGGLIDQSALRTAILEGRIAGFAADVLESEPPSAGDPLLSSPRVLLTPHVASLTDATYREMCVFTAKNVVAVLQGRPPAVGAVYDRAHC